ncbi:MAG: hypothetical protein BWY88_00566 [Synergistetes bacterium ADurb.Bin520]|nr:MAG: hypothetical protein BWY88_00566 [Synergistetes bacterium ADurb.Bin520]
MSMLHDMSCTVSKMLSTSADISSEAEAVLSVEAFRSSRALAMLWMPALASSALWAISPRRAAMSPTASLTSKMVALISWLPATMVWDTRERAPAEAPMRSEASATEARDWRREEPMCSRARAMILSRSAPVRAKGRSPGGGGSKGAFRSRLDKKVTSSSPRPKRKIRDRRRSTGRLMLPATSTAAATPKAVPRAAPRATWWRNWAIRGAADSGGIKAAMGWAACQAMAATPPQATAPARPTTMVILACRFRMTILLSPESSGPFTRLGGLFRRSVPAPIRGGPVPR